MCCDSIFNFLNRVTDGSFLFLCKTVVFLFLPFLNLGDQISCPQNRYTDLKSALDQPLYYEADSNFLKSFILKPITILKHKDPNANKKRKQFWISKKKTPWNCTIAVIKKSFTRILERYFFWSTSSREWNIDLDIKVKFTILFITSLKREGQHKILEKIITDYPRLRNLFKFYPFLFIRANPPLVKGTLTQI